MSKDSWMLTTLNELLVASRPVITLSSSFWYGSFSCLGETVRDSILNYYWEISVIASVMSTL